MVMSLWPRFLAHPVGLHNASDNDGQSRQTTTVHLVVDGNILVALGFCQFRYRSSF